MNIVYALTRNYYRKLKPSLTSLLEHNPEARVFLLAEDDEVDYPVEVINVTNQKWFPQNSINYHNMFTYINLLKVCYQEILDVDRVIHLDCDTIINDSLEPMWNIDLEGKWIGAVQEYQGRYRPFGEIYYNMGVAVLNLKQMREDGCQQKMVDYLNTVKQPWADQDAFNKYGLGEDKFVPLDVRWNENKMTGFTDNPGIIHYCSISNWYENRFMSRREYLDRYI